MNSQLILREQYLILFSIYCFFLITIRGFPTTIANSWIALIIEEPDYRPFATLTVTRKDVIETSSPKEMDSYCPSGILMGMYRFAQFNDDCNRLKVHNLEQSRKYLLAQN